MYGSSGFLQDFLFTHINALRKYVILKDHEKIKTTENFLLQKQNHFQENEKHFTYIFALSAVHVVCTNVVSEILCVLKLLF